MYSIAPKHSFTFGGSVVNVYHASQGQGLLRHTHNYNHATVCHSGSCVVRVEGKELIMNKNTKPVNLVGSEWHEIEALEPNTVFVNIFAEDKY
jgi:quercetin dioxygenase-like cupin family protein